MNTLTRSPASGRRDKPPAGALSNQKRRQAIAAWVFLSPSLLFFAVFLVLPLLFAAMLSLSVWGGFDLSRIEYAGVDNFSQILGSSTESMIPVLLNTLVFACGAVGLALVAAIALANAINRLRFQGLWRTLYFLPLVTTVVAIGNIWKLMYEPTGGLINGFLNFLGLESVRFLYDPATALPSVIVVQAWASVGMAILILTAGLKSIPHSYYEAAELDGTNVWTAFWHITLPLLRPTLLFVTITQFITALQSFALIIVMTQGGPADATNVAGFEIYQQAFQFGAWGIANAMALLLFIVIFAITLLQLRIFRRKGEETS